MIKQDAHKIVRVLGGAVGVGGRLVLLFGLHRFGILAMEFSRVDACQQCAHF
jgi:hypothetical protein